MFDNFSKTELTVLNYFLNNSDKEFHLREIARKLKISSSTSKTAIDSLCKKDLVKEKKLANLRLFRCNTDNLIVKQLRITKNLQWLKEKKLIKKIKEELNPSSIVLFGSFAKGTNTEKSDLDILVITNRKDNLKEHFIDNYEMQIITMKAAEWAKKGEKKDPFYYEIIVDGIVLYGRMPL